MVRNVILPRIGLRKILINLADSVEALEAYLDGLGTQFSCFDSCLQGVFSIAFPPYSSKERQLISSIKDNFHV